MKFLPTLLLASTFSFSMLSFADESSNAEEAHAHVTLDAQAVDAIAADATAVIVTTQDDLSNSENSPEPTTPQLDQSQPTNTTTEEATTIAPQE